MLLIEHRVGCRLIRTVELQPEADSAAPRYETHVIEPESAHLVGRYTDALWARRAHAWIVHHEQQHAQAQEPQHAQ